MGEFDKLKASETDSYTVAYTYATYLSTTKRISPEEAIPMLSELIAMGYPTAARYCINNLEKNGIHSFDLLALRGLCFQHELQPDMASTDLEAALKGDPGNEKIQILINNLRKQSTEAEDMPLHEALFRKGMTSLQNQDYDSAFYYLKKAGQIENRPEYVAYITRLENIIEGEQIIKSTPDNYKAYMQKSQGLSAMQLFREAQITLDGGLIACPDNLNLILAKALVWVQEGETENARLYLWEQEQRGIAIDPVVKQKILQAKN
ncbi:MAG: hypothetical protein QNK35_18665 [Bacteroides sp.]|nr:hypothetical protein [Bacteroides sp.]